MKLNNRFLRSILMLFAAIAVAIGATSCSSDADVASRNLSKDAENFNIARRVVFYNGITDKYMLVIEGRCSVEQQDIGLTVTCKDGDEFKKHYLGRSDNVTWFAQQLKGAEVSTGQYKVVFKPTTILPDVEAR